MEEDNGKQYGDRAEGEVTVSAETVMGDRKGFPSSHECEVWGKAV